jgi:hypothetical protein
MILVPIWGREKITELCLDNLKELKKDYNIDVICVVSEQWAKIKAFEKGFKYVEVENFPLGNKMNKGVEYALRFDFDYLMNLGSDDLIDGRLFDLYKPHIEQKKKVFGINKVTFFDSKTKQLKRFDYKHMIGAGRMISREVLMKYAPIYTPDKNKCLDDNSAFNMFGVQFNEIESEDDLIIDIKSDENIWAFDYFKGETSELNTLKVSDNILTKLIEL